MWRGSPAACKIKGSKNQNREGVLRLTNKILPQVPSSDKSQNSFFSSRLKICRNLNVRSIGSVHHNDNYYFVVIY